MQSNPVTVGEVTEISVNGLGLVAKSVRGEVEYMFRIMVRVITLVFCLILVASSAQAAGLYLYENGTPDLGLAAAGRAALAQEASTVVGNPAGMTRLDRSQLTGSLFTMLPSMQFDRGAVLKKRDK